jgi:elongation factor Ts
MTSAGTAVGVTAAQVKELRERTGAGMSDCKKALDATGGDIDKAVENLRTAGAAKADKKASRTAAEGVIAVASSPDAVALVELNSETDFVAKGEDFRALAKSAAAVALKDRPATLEGLVNTAVNGETLDQTRRNLVARIGENIAIRRYEIIKKGAGELVTYIHPGDKIVVVMAMDAGEAQLGRDLAMHAAAMAPRYLSSADIPAATLEAERKVIEATMAQEQVDAKAESDKLAGVLAEMDAEKKSGVYDGLSADDKKHWDDDYAKIKKKFGGGYKAKPADILTKMAEGKIRKFAAEITLLGQEFVRNADYGMKSGDTIEALLKAKNAKLCRFIRYAVGEGIEKQQTDFAAEVAAMAKA